MLLDMFSGITFRYFNIIDFTCCIILWLLFTHVTNSMHYMYMTHVSWCFWSLVEVVESYWESLVEVVESYWESLVEIVESYWESLVEVVESYWESYK